MTKRCPRCSAANAPTAEKCDCRLDISDLPLEALAAYYYPNPFFTDPLAFHSALLYFDTVFIDFPVRPGELKFSRDEKPETKAFERTIQLFVPFMEQAVPVLEAGILRQVRWGFAADEALKGLAKFSWFDTATDTSQVLRESAEKLLPDEYFYRIGQLREAGDPSPLDWSTRVHSFRLFYRTLLARIDNMTLMTDDATHAAALSAVRGVMPLPRSDDDRVSTVHEKAARLIAKALRLELPIILGRDVEDVLWLRERLADELGGFKSEMASLAAGISAAPWDEEFDFAAVDTVVGKVRGEVSGLRRKLRSPGKAYAKHLLADAKTFVTTGATLGLAVSAGAPVEVAGSLSALASLLTAGISTASARRATKKENSMTFLLEAERHLLKRSR